MTESQRYPEVRIRGAGSFHLPGLGEGRIAGSGEISRDSVTTRGSASLPGGIKAPRLESSGSLRVSGDLDAEKADLEGSASIEGAFRFREAGSRGSLRVKRDAEGVNLDTAGSAHVNGSIRLTGTLTSRGGVSAEGGIEASEVKFKGALQTRGRLDAKNIQGVLAGATSRVDGGITGDTVTVRRGDSESWFNDPELITLSVTGGNISIEYVTCGTVTGKRIDVGPHCRVAGPVKYTESINIHPTAHLEEPPTKVEGN